MKPLGLSECTKEYIESNLRAHFHGKLNYEFDGCVETLKSLWTTIPKCIKIIVHMDCDGNTVGAMIKW